ncbi:MAG: hypothetical protein JSV79_02825 [Armatimonadota bacterium]|nr:MAG: hypothetical protein JSV79_02825 [Armatimonadota bacterium]
MAGPSWNRVFRIAFLVVLGAVAGWWVVHPRPSDEDLIAELVAKAEHGVETKSVDEIMSCVSRDYSGQGEMSREDVWRSAQQWVRSPVQADVVIQDYQLALKDAEAVGQFQVDVRLQEEGGLVQTLNLFLTVGFERQRRGLRKVWLVKSVRGFDPDELIEEML